MTEVTPETAITDSVRVSSSVSVPRATLLSFAGIGALGATRLVYNVMVGRVDGPTTLGKVGVGISFATFASLAMAAGTAPAASKFAALHLGRGQRAEATSIIRVLGRWTLIGTLLIIVVAAVVSPWVLPDLDRSQVVLSLALTATYSGYTFTKGTLYGIGKVARYALLETSTDTIALLLTAVALVIGSQLLLLPLVLGYASFTLMALWSSPGGGKPYIRHELRGEVRAFVALSVTGTLASTGFLQLSMISARHYGSSSQAGFFAAILSLLSPAYFLPRGLSLALFPSMARAHGQGATDSIARQTDLSTRLLIVTMLPVFAMGAILARPVLEVTFGSRFVAGQTTFAIMLAATFISIIPVPAVNSITSIEARYVRIPAIASIAGLVIGIVWWVLLGPKGGIEQIAIGYLLGSIVQCIVPMGVAWRQYKFRWTPLAMRTACGVCVSVLAQVYLMGHAVLTLTRLAFVAMIFLGWMVIAWPDEKALLVGWRRVRSLRA